MGIQIVSMWGKRAGFECKNVKSFFVVLHFNFSGCKYLMVSPPMIYWIKKQFMAAVDLCSFNHGLGIYIWLFFSEH
jgi:hypothetical protein